MTYTVTRKGLYKWYESVYEKVGWMVLAKNNGRKYKLNAFEEELKHLLEALKEKIEQVNDVDSKNDLIILQDNTIVLLKFFSKSFINKKSKRKSK